MTTIRKWLLVAGPIIAAAIAILDDGAVSAEEAGFLLTTALSAFGIWPNQS